MNITMTTLFCLLIGTVAIIGFLEVKNNTLSIGALTAFLIYTMNFFLQFKKSCHCLLILKLV